jgi:cytochrome P450
MPERHRPYREAAMSFFTPEMRRDPYPIYQRMRRDAPVLHYPPTDAWMLFGHDAVKRALTDHETFSSAVSGGTPARWLIFQDPPRHSKLRALVSRAFTSRAVAGLEPRIEQLTAELLDAVVDRGAMDLVGDLAVPLPLMVIARMLGAPVEDWPRFRAWSDAILKLSHTAAGDDDAGDAELGYDAVTREMERYLDGLLAERRRAPADDLLTRLLQAEVDGERLDDEQILAFFQLLLVAGHETTTNLISNAVICLLDHPAQLARLTAEPRLLPSAIEEVLRYRSPVQAMFRATRRDVDIDGRRVPAGRLVLTMIGSANRDDAVFADAERFDIGRDPNPHIAFGHGIHFCVGAPLSRLEARVALTALLGRARDLRRASDAPWEPREAFNVHGPTALPVRFALRER